MPKLILKRKAEVLKEFLLKNDQATVSIGSDEDNDLVIEDRRVSNRHLLIERRGTTYFARDLKSAFGTFMHGKKLDDPVELHHGDQLQIADFTLVFSNPLEAARHSEEYSPAAGEEERQTEVEEQEARPESEEIRLDETTADVDKAFAAASAQQSDDDGLQGGEMAPYYLLAIYGPYAGSVFN